MIAIEVAGLHKSFGDVRALRGVNLRIHEGEFYGLLGPNGAGKTTLLRILSGLLRADAGGVSILGHPAGGREAAQFLGVVPQEIALYDMLSARRNLELFGALHGMDGHRLSDRVGHVLSVVGLEDQRARRVKTFSGGMKRRLNLAVGLLHDPPVLLLDEPTVGVDPQSRVKIFSLLRELHAAGKTIVYTTHYMEEAERLCERIGIIDRGAVLAEGTQPQLYTQVSLPRSVRVFFRDRTGAAPEVTGADAMRDGDHVDYVPRGEEPLGAVVAQIERAGRPYDRIEIVGPGLETLFLQLTGKELRD